MAWLTANLPLILTVWAGAGFLAGAAGHLLPVGRAQCWLLAFSSISPLDLVSAWKKIGIALTPPTMTPVEPTK